MIRIRYFPGECEVSGTPADLRSVAIRLQRIAITGERRVILADTDFDPTPYSDKLSRLVILRNEKKDKISIEDGSLVLTGSARGLLRLASFFDFPDEAQHGAHVHHEACYSPEFTHAASHPLVVSVEREVAPARPANATTRRG
jgi:hypothetical protein